MNQPTFPQSITTDMHGAYRLALRTIGLDNIHRSGGRRKNNRAENSHLPIRRRERKMQLFKTQNSAQNFLTTHSAVYNTFYVQPHLVTRKTLRQFRADARSAWASATSVQIG